METKTAVEITSSAAIDGVTRKPKLMTIGLVAIAIAVLGIGGIYWLSPSLIEARILHVVDFHSPDANGVWQDRFVTMRIGNQGSTTVIFSENQKVQARSGSNWLEPTKVSRLNQAVLWPGMERDDLVVCFPPRTEACRISLEYRECDERVYRLQALLTKLGLGQRFPKFCDYALRCFAGKPGLRQVEFEFRLPPES